MSATPRSDAPSRQTTPIHRYIWMLSFMACSTGHSTVVAYVDNYGASGSTVETSCTAQAGSNTLQCSEIKDFKIGHGVMIKEGGTPPQGKAYPVLPAPTIRQVGQQSGTTQYCYVVAVGDPQHGLQPPSPPACLSNQASALSLDNHHEIWLPNSFHTSVNNSGMPHGDLAHMVPLYLWYVSIDGGPYSLLHLSYEHDIRGSFRHASTARPNKDFGGWPLTLTGALNSDNVVRNNDLFATITNIVDTGTGYQVSLDKSLSHATTSLTVAHDDTAAVQRAIDAADATGVSVRFSAKTYNLQRPSYSTFNSTSPFTTDSLTGPWIAWWTYSHTLHLPITNRSNVTLQGSTQSGARTVIKTGPGAAFGSFLHMSTPQMEQQGGPAYVANSDFRIAPADKGQTTIQLADPSQAGRLHANDDVWLYSGNYDPTPLTDPNYRPCVAGTNPYAGNCHFSELNTIASVDTSSGIVTLALPLTKKYWFDGRNDFGLVKLDKLPHNIRVSNLTFDSYHRLLNEGSATFNVTVDNVRYLNVVPGSAMGTGSKRGFRVLNSYFQLGAGSFGWSQWDEFDQVNDVLFSGNTLIGYATPKSEGPSQGTALFFSEGTNNLNFRNNTVSNIQLNLQVGDEIYIQGNRFINSMPWIGASQRSPFRTTRDAGDYMSYASQHHAEISDNTFTIDNSFEPLFVISMGTYDQGFIQRNTFKNQTARPDSWSIFATSGTISDNNIDLSGSSINRPSFIWISPDVDAKPFSVKSNTLTGTLPYVVSAFKPLGTSASICVSGNTRNGAPWDTVQATDAYYLGYNFLASCAN